MRNKKGRKDNIFVDMPSPSLPSNQFDLTRCVTTSFNMGPLIPVNWFEVLPGDTLTMSDENLFRLAPMVAPVMHDVHVTVHAWFTPYRLLWDGFEDMITGKNPDRVHPFVNVSNIGLKSIPNYMGFPLGDLTDPEPVTPFPVAAYALIYDEWYRDQNFCEEKFIPLVDGLNDDYLVLFDETPFKRAWMHDEFTSALPEAQQGTPVSIPLVVQDNVPVLYVNRPGGDNQNTGSWVFSNNVPATSGDPVLATTGPSPLVAGSTVDGEYVAYNPQGTLVVDIQADAADISDFRAAWAVQSLLERMMRGGARYTEMLQAVWGVSPSDSRLQRPEYIGGSKARVVFSQVLATASNLDPDDGNPIGEMAGHGVCVSGGGRYTYTAQEYGCVIFIVNMQPVTSYQQGLHRSWSRLDRFDYPFPDLANIGEQPLLNKQVKMTANEEDRNATFGYLPQYNELRFLNNMTTGEFQTSLAFWTMTRVLEGPEPPELNQSFIEADPTFRIFAVESTGVDHVYAQMYFNVIAYRKLPRFGVPAKLG